MVCVITRLCGCRSGAAKRRDRKSTRLNSSHRTISYAVFCLKKKNVCIFTFMYFTAASTPTTDLIHRTNTQKQKHPNPMRMQSVNSSAVVLKQFFFFNDTAPTEIYPLSLHAALPI